MKRKTNPELIDKENPEWTEEDFQHAQPASEVLPELFGPQVAAEMLKPRGRPKASAVKIHVNIRLDADILEALRSTGPGWQTRINKVLRDWLKERKPKKSQRA
ncbi:MAG: BrnA antitoxin family protein [Syntrophobacteraceae bacterium]